MLKIIDAIVKLGLALPEWLAWGLVFAEVISQIGNYKINSNTKLSSKSIKSYKNQREINIKRFIFWSVAITIFTVFFCENLSEILIDHYKGNVIYNKVESNYRNRFPIFVSSFLVVTVFHSVFLIIFCKYNRSLNAIFLLLIVAVNFTCFWGAATLFDKYDSSSYYWNAKYHEIGGWIYVLPTILGIIGGTIFILLTINIDFDWSTKYNNKKYQCTGQTVRGTRCKNYVSEKNGNCGKCGSQKNRKRRR